MAPLGDGKVLVAGGWTEAGPVVTASAEIYDPVSGTFTATASMHHGRLESTATPLPTCQILVTGGDLPSDQPQRGDSSAELFTPFLDDANIRITTPGARRFGQPQTLTAHVNVCDGAGVHPAPAGTEVDFTIRSGPGHFLSPSACIVSDGSGDCHVVVSSPVTGVTTVSALTTLDVDGKTLTRSTDGAAANSDPAWQRWVDAKIAIRAPQPSRVGQPVTFTARLEKDTGTGSFEPAAGEPVTITATASNGASLTPLGPVTCTTNEAGECAASFTSATTGTASATASSTLSVANSASFTVNTDGNGANSGSASATWVNARILVAQTERNPWDHSHTLTATLEKDTGTGSWVPAAGEKLTIMLAGSGGAVPSPAGPLSCMTDSVGRCSVAFVLSTTGTVIGHAASTLSVGGSSSFTVESDGIAPNSGDALAVSTVGEPRPSSAEPPTAEPRPAVPDLSAPPARRPPQPIR
jgi:hypothetical protein